jgi:hypothetical protein
MAPLLCYTDPRYCCVAMSASSGCVVTRQPFMCQLQSPWPYSEGVEQRIIFRGVVHADAVLCLDDWLCHWSLLAVNDPVAAQVGTCILISS